MRLKLFFKKDQQRKIIYPKNLFNTLIKHNTASISILKVPAKKMLFTEYIPFVSLWSAIKSLWHKDLRLLVLTLCQIYIITSPHWFHARSRSDNGWEQSFSDGKIWIICSFVQLSSASLVSMMLVCTVLFGARWQIENHLF